MTTPETDYDLGADMKNRIYGGERIRDLEDQLRQVRAAYERLQTAHTALHKKHTRDFRLYK